MNRPFKSCSLFLMGTKIDLTIEHTHAARLLLEAEKILKDFEVRFNANSDSSLLAKINQSSSVKPIAIDDDLFELIEIGKKESLEHNSGLNIAIGPLIQRWRIGFDNAQKPSKNEIKDLLNLIDPSLIQLNNKNKTVYLPYSGMKIDLGALAKGFFADKLCQFFQQNGVRSALINLGGNVLAYGDSPITAQQGWRVGVQNPFLPRGNYIAALNINHHSVVTSGIYERQAMFDGKPYHHIFDSQTGYPIETDVASITILSESSLDGEIWTTKLFNRTAKEVLLELNKLEYINGLVITRSGEYAFSKGLKPYLISL